MVVAVDLIRQGPEVVGQVAGEGAQEQHQTGEQNKIESYAPAAGGTVGGEMKSLNKKDIVTLRRYCETGGEKLSE